MSRWVNVYCVLGAHARGTRKNGSLFQALLLYPLLSPQQSVEAHVQTARPGQDRQQQVADDPFFSLSVSGALGQRARIDAGFRCGADADVRAVFPFFESVRRQRSRAGNAQQRSLSRV